jgi:signal transduction histidine kinase
MSTLDLTSAPRYIRGATNAALAALFTVILAAEAWTLASDHKNVVLDCLAGSAVCAAAVLRERNRAWAAATGLAVAGAAEVIAGCWHLTGEPGVATTVALFVLVGSALRVLPVRQAAAIAATAAAVAITETYSHPAARQTLVLAWAIVVLAALGLRFWPQYRAAQREAAIETVRRTERLELARELHDAAAHHLTGIVIQAQAARIAARANADALDHALAAIEAGGADALASMRQVIGLLRNESANTDGLTPGPPRLTELVVNFAASGGPAIRLAGQVDDTWPPELAATIYRVAQEALTNITRHASAASVVTITLITGKHEVTVEIADDAPAQTARFPHVSGYGLIGLRERVEMLGGTLTAGRGDSGWSVRATLPTP